MYLFYDGFPDNIDPHYVTGLTVSTDGGDTWNNFTGNPLLITGPDPLVTNLTAPFLYKSKSGTYYWWGSVRAHGIANTNVWRAESNSLYGPWVQSTSHFSLESYSSVNGVPVNGVGVGIGQLADCTMYEKDGKTYMLASGLPDQQTLHYELFVFNGTMDQLVLTQEGLKTPIKGEWIPNGSFEEITPSLPQLSCYWINSPDDGNVSRTTVPSEVHPNSSRTVACKLTAGTNTDTYTYQTVLGLIPGRVYTLTGYSRGDGVNAGRLRIQNSSSVDLITWPTTLASETSYVQFNITFIVPLDGKAKISCYCPATVRGIAYFDDLTLIPN